MKAAATDAGRKIIAAARTLSDQVDALSFGQPVTHVYNPLRYAWNAHQAYLSRVGHCNLAALFLGMNPGPWGMAQTGVPFGEIEAVRDWIGINVPIDRPAQEHPKRPVEGFQCGRSEVSGRRLWGLFRERFGSAEDFFAEHFVANYCPLVFMEASGRNRTPDKLPSSQRQPLIDACDRHLRTVLEALRPTWAVGVGGYAEDCLRRVLDGGSLPTRVVRILHPSPASPAANRDWAGKVTQQLTEAGLW